MNWKKAYKKPEEIEFREPIEETEEVWSSATLPSAIAVKELDYIVRINKGKEFVMKIEDFNNYYEERK